MPNGVEKCRFGFLRRRDAPKKAKLSEGTFERSENPKGAQTGAPNGGFSDEAICAGLDGAANLKIAASSGGRANRPYQKLSTVGRTVTKPLQAQHSQPTYAADLRHQRC